MPTPTAAASPNPQTSRPNDPGVDAPRADNPSNAVPFLSVLCSDSSPWPESRIREHPDSFVVTLVAPGDSDPLSSGPGRIVAELALSVAPRTAPSSVSDGEVREAHVLRLANALAGQVHQGQHLALYYPADNPAGHAVAKACDRFYASTVFTERTDARDPRGIAAVIRQALTDAEIAAARQAARQAARSQPTAAEMIGATMQYAMQDVHAKLAEAGFGERVAPDGTTTEGGAPLTHTMRQMPRFVQRWLHKPMVSFGFLGLGLLVAGVLIGVVALWYRVALGVGYRPLLALVTLCIELGGISLAFGLFGEQLQMQAEQMRILRDEVAQWRRASEASATETPLTEPPATAR